MEIELYKELETFIKVWLLAFLSASYCYLIPKRISNGYERLLSLIPAMFGFSILPFPLSIVHLRVPTVCYLAWYANFKLVLFAFNRGPLASTPPLPFFIFISIALFPIKHTSQNKVLNPTDQTLSSGSHQPKITGPESVSVPSYRPVRLAFKAMIFAMIVRAYQYKDNLNENVLVAFYCSHIYLATELMMAITAFFVGICLGFKVDMDPQFNEPYLATSLQDFGADVGT
nr:long-chain-alcohol O-fatty-acyltransferase-like [Tanacetum cinerariifolium]